MDSVGALFTVATYQNVPGVCQRKSTHRECCHPCATALPVRSAAIHVARLIVSQSTFSVGGSRFRLARARAGLPSRHVFVDDVAAGPRPIGRNFTSSVDDTVQHELDGDSSSVERIVYERARDTREPPEPRSR